MSKLELIERDIETLSAKERQELKVWLESLETTQVQALSSTPPTKPFALRAPIIVNRTGKAVNNTVIERRAAREQNP